MFIIEVVPLSAIERHQKKILSFYHAKNLPAGSLVEIPVHGKKTKGIVINSQSIKYLKIRIKKEADFELRPINKVLKKNLASGKESFDITIWFPVKEKSSENQKTRVISRPVENKNILDGYLDRLAERKAAILFSQSFKEQAKARTYMQETAEPYLQFIDWENDTFEKDMRLFWVSASNYYRSHTHHDFVKILDWIKKKDCLTPKQVAKLFNKEQKRYTKQDGNYSRTK